MGDLIKLAFLGIASWLHCCATGHRPEHTKTTICRCGTSLWRGK